MKRVMIGLVTYMLLMSNAFACQTQTIIINGKVIICTYCPNYTMCN